jgi:hypothetical protein
VVETVLGDVGLLADVLLLLALSDGSGLLGEALLLLGLGLGTVLVEDLESLGGKVTVGNVLELGNRRWDLQAHVKNLLLALKTDVSAAHHQYLQGVVDSGVCLRPSDHAADVALGLDVLTDAIVARTLLDERVL